jgi:hypothetical protein
MASEVNFRQIAQELVDAYGTDEAVSKLVGCNLTTIWRMRVGRLITPNWVMGDKLLKLHASRPKLKKRAG